jgi:hypothetical protein
MVKVAARRSCRIDDDARRIGEPGDVLCPAHAGNNTAKKSNAKTVRRRVS